MRAPLLYFLALSLLGLGACGFGDSGSGGEAPENIGKPPSMGSPGRISVIADSVLWQGPIGEQLRKIFERPMPGLLREEPYFNLVHIDPDHFSRFVRREHNLLFVHCQGYSSPQSKKMREYFAEKTLKKVRKEKGPFFFKGSEKHAKNQRINYLVAADEEGFLRYLKKKGDGLFRSYRNSEADFSKKRAYAQGVADNLSDSIAQASDFRIRLPKGYITGRVAERFRWFGRMEPKRQWNLWLTWKPYRSQMEFTPQNLIEWRDSVARYYLTGTGEVGDTVSYMMTERLLPVRTRPTEINGHYATEVRGAWRLKDHSRGGVFLAYAVLDKARQRVYYVESFVYAPGDLEKAPLVWQMDAILRSFEPKPQQQKSAIFAGN